ncbi:MFS transporter [Nocardia sp. NPDC050710]|uniref:MFS transporter n=1 Tax=Nocardia sp. NPDC050710 TaxID=3157220 RepID=UPI0033F88592
MAGVPIGIFVERWIGWRGVLWLIAAGGAIAALLVDRYGPNRTLTIALMGTGLGLLALGPATHTAWTVFAVLAVTGLFGGMTMVPQQHRLFGIASDAPTVALGLNGSAIYLGGGIGSLLGGAVLDTAGSRWLPLASAVGLRTAR